MEWLNIKDAQPDNEVFIASVEDYEEYVYPRDCTAIQRGQRWKLQTGRYAKDENSWVVNDGYGYYDTIPAKDSDYWFDPYRNAPHDLPDPTTETVPGTTTAEREAHAKAEQDKAVQFFTEFSERHNKSKQ